MEDIEILRNKILLFNEFLVERLGIPSEFFIETNDLIEKAYQEKNMKVLKSGDKEIYLQLKEMPLEMKLELKELFKEKLDLDILEKLFDKNIEKIIKRGIILNDDEYRILVDKMDNLIEIKSETEIQKINTLLSEYSNK